MKKSTRFMALLLLVCMVSLSLPVFAEVTPTEIILSPSEVEVWLNVGFDLQLKTTVKGSNTSQALEYVSSNENVVTVSADGTLTSVGEGSAYVYAMATDGSEAVSNFVWVNILPERIIEEDQLITLPKTSSPRININDYFAWPKGGYGAANIALWKDNYTGVVTITVDDNIKGDFDDWNNYASNFGIYATFCAPTAGIKDSQSTWEEMIRLGHAVQSHTWYHPSTGDYGNLSSAEEWMDFYRSANDISSLPTTSHMIAYSWGYNAPEMTRLLFSSGRGVTGTSNPAATIDYNELGSYSGTRAGKIQSEIDAVYTTNKGNWVSYHFHSLSNEGGRMNEYISYLAQQRDAGNVWVPLFAEAAQYGQERDTATLTMKNVSSGSISFEVTDKMSDELFTYPLTIKIKVDATWQYAAAYQSGEWREVKVVSNSEGTFLMVDAVPDKGEVVVTRTAEAHEKPAQEEIVYGDAGDAGDYTMTEVYYGKETPKGGDVVVISSENEWNLFAQYVGAGNSGAGITFKITRDLDLTTLDYLYTVGREIAIGTATLYPFKGHFDGCGHTVTYESLRGGQYSALFAYLSGAVVENLNVNATVTGSICTGGIAGEASGGSVIRNCTVRGSVKSLLTKISQSSCSWAGGIVGNLLNQSTVQGCVNYATVSAPGENVGGIAGGFTNSNVGNCANFGSVSGQKNVGGLVGRINSTSSGVEPHVYNCLSAGAVSGEELVGGVAGFIGTKSYCWARNVLVTASVTALSSSENIGSIFGRIERDNYHHPTMEVYYLASVNEGMQTANAVDFSAEKVITFTPTAITEQDLTSQAFLTTLSQKATALSAADCTAWQTVTVGGVSVPSPVYATSNVEPPVYPEAPTTYTVTFLGDAGQVVKIESVAFGTSANAPAVPAPLGYDFAGWSADFSAVASDLTVKALFERNETPLPVSYTVTFLGQNGEVLSSQSILQGEAAIAPTAPKVTGYTFQGWSADFSVVTSNLTVEALYTKNYSLESDAAYIEFKSLVNAFSSSQTSLADTYTALYRASQAFARIEGKTEAKNTQAYTQYIAAITSYNQAANTRAQDIDKPL